MANILDTIRGTNDIYIVVDADPALGGGTKAGVGSLAIGPTAITYQKTGLAATSWVAVASPGGAIPSPSVEANLGVLTWSNTAPSGVISAKYRYQRIGKQITFWAKITASIAGAGNDHLSFALPIGVPVPAQWTVQESGGIVSVGSGILTPTLSLPLNTTGSSVIADDGSGGFTIAIAGFTVNAVAAWCELSWITT